MWFQSWFHGSINRKVAESIIVAHGNGDGLFLIRNASGANDYVITLRSVATIFHFQVDRFVKFLSDSNINHCLGNAVGGQLAEH